MSRDLLTLVAAFALGTLAGEVGGAANLGISATFGTFAFTAALLWVLLRRP